MEVFPDVKISGALRYRASVARLLWMAALATLGCAAGRPAASPATSVSEPSPSRDVQQEISDLKGGLSDPGIAAPPEPHLRLARLYLDHRNPSPEYGLALKELELYAALDEKGGRSDEVRDWLAALRRIAALEEERAAWNGRLQAKEEALAEGRKARAENERALERARRGGEEARKSAETLAREKAELVEELKQLRKENQEMRETIQKLKALDLELEELRRKTRP